MEAAGGLTMRILWLVVCSFLLSTGLVHAQLGPESLKGPDQNKAIGGAAR